MIGALHLLRPGLLVKAGPTVYFLALGGSLGSSSAVTRQAVKLVAGTVGPAAALGRVPTKGLAGATSPGGVLARVPARHLAGAAGMSASLGDQPARKLAGTVAPTGVVLTLRMGVRSFGGTLTTAGAVAKTAQTFRAGAVTSSGLLAKTASYHQTQTGAASAAGAITRTATKMEAGAVAATGAIKQQAAKTVSGSTSAAGTLTRLIAKGLGGAFGSSGLLVALPIRIVPLTIPGAALGMSGAASRVITKMVTHGRVRIDPGPHGPLHAGFTNTANVDPKGDTTITPVLTFGGSLAVGGAITKTVPRAFAGSIMAAGDLAIAAVKVYALTLSGSLTMAGDVGTKFIAAPDVPQPPFVEPGGGGGGGFAPVPVNRYAPTRPEVPRAPVVYTKLLTGGLSFDGVLTSRRIAGMRHAEIRAEEIVAIRVVPRTGPSSGADRGVVDPVVDLDVSIRALGMVGALTMAGTLTMQIIPAFDDLIEGIL